MNNEDEYIKEYNKGIIDEEFYSDIKHAHKDQIHFMDVKSEDAKVEALIGIWNLDD